MIIKIYNFRDDLSNISAKTATLDAMRTSTRKLFITNMYIISILCGSEHQKKALLDVAVFSPPASARNA